MKIEDYNEYYIQGSDHYLIPKDVFKELFNEMVNWREEAKELKKQLEVSNELVAQGTLTEMKLRDENNRLRKEYQDTYKDVRIEIKEYKTQQKEFINFLEDNYKETQDIWYIKILQKYRSIIGVSDENNMGK